MLTAVTAEEKNSHKFIVTIPVRNPWWKGILLKRAKDLLTYLNEAQEQLW